MSALGLSDARLVNRYRRMVVLIVLPLLALVVILAIVQYRAQRERIVRELASQTASHVVELQSIVDDALDYVFRLRQRFERYASAPPAYLESRPEYFQPRPARDGYTFDAMPEPLRRELGNVVWPKSTPTGSAAALDMAFDFFSQASLGHRQNAYLQWTYYYAAGGDLFYIFPWAPIRSVVEGAGHDSLAQAIPAWLALELYQAGTPEKNPQAREYWTAPYVDVAGAGTMVTLASPVYVDSGFAGVVATDIRLEVMHKFLEQLRLTIGRELLLDGANTLLADSARFPGNEVHSVERVLPAGLLLADIDAAKTSPGRAYRTAGYIVVARAVPNTPWTMVYVASDAEIRGHLLPNFVPYVVISLAVAGAFVLVLWLLRRQFIEPAFQLVRYIQRETREETATIPRVPALWRPWLDAVAAAFHSNRESNRKLRASEAFKSSILENAVVGVVTIDRDGCIVDINPAAERMFAVTRAAMSGRGFVNAILAPASWERFLQFWSSHGHPGAQPARTNALELVAQRSDGTALTIALSMSATESADAQYVTVFISDLTEQKRSEEQLARQREALRQSEKMSAMGALLAGVAHELNNPLAILMGRAALLQGKVKDPAAKDAAQRIYATAERCGRIVRTFLSMARQRPPERRLAQLNDVVEGALELLGYGLRSAGVSTVTRFDPLLPMASMDADQIGQVVINLIVNAQHALADRRCDTLERREISIETRHADDKVELRVADNGPGIAPALRQRIFDPFFTTKPVGTGTGVGLAVSLAIAREHGGDLRLEPSSVGALFVLSLPLGQAQEPLRARRRPDEVDEELLAGHALIVDDETEMTDVLGDILESAGFITTRFTSSRAALAWLQQHDCNVILTDLRMPDLDGPALWRALREQRPELAARVGFITGDTLSASVEPFLESTGQPWLEKPFTPEQVLELVARIEAGK
ncbi:MAG TPA: ATP-binding protein [Steroidobacteraceae bacterium]|nr:ATP-binding protein [Steroidobacteraceae bacterium]